MREWTIGLVVGMVLGVAAVGAAQPEPEAVLRQAAVGAPRGATLAIPPQYGQLVSVAVTSEVHYLYFQDAGGTIRIVLVGAPGAVQRARQGLQLLTNEVYTIERRIPELEG